MTSDSTSDFRRQADQVRQLPLEVVLNAWGAKRDPRDGSRWRTERGTISVTGAKFFNWHEHQGGGGAIDLVIHLSGRSAAEAIRWLARHSGSGVLTRPLMVAPVSDVHRPRPALQLPLRSAAHLACVKQYLTEQRGLAADALDRLIDTGMLYADQRANAVFLMVAGRPNRAIGAELRGTGPRVWRGLTPGTRRNAGYFWVGDTTSKTIILCESAIDAISCYQLHTQFTCSPRQADQLNCICISTAGVRHNALWLVPLIARGYTIYCGFDNDPPGDQAAARMIQRYAPVRRLRPPAHDWNDALRERR